MALRYSLKVLTKLLTGKFILQDYKDDLGLLADSIDTNITNIGLNTDDINDILVELGTLSVLSTTEKTNLVAAINELVTSITALTPDIVANSNGTYIKYPDGRLICYSLDLTLSYSTTSTLVTTWNFPCAFLTGTKPNINWVPYSGLSAAKCSNMQFLANTSDVVTQFVLGSNAAFVSGDSITARGTAIGKWK